MTSKDKSDSNGIGNGSGVISNSDNFTFNDEIKPIVVKRFDEMKKEIVIQSASQFNNKTVNSIKCIEILTDLIYLINQGYVFSQQEHENLFFSVTKLFNTKENDLRRTAFLFLKHFDINPNFGFILIGQLSTFIQGDDKMLKTNSFKIIGGLIDVTTKSMIDNSLKIGISNSNLPSNIISSCILCAFELTCRGSQLTKQWISEINERLNSSLEQENLLAFHTLLLLKELKSNDKIYLIKTFTNISSNIKGQFATCQLLRYISEVFKKFEIEDTKQLNSLLSFIESCCSGRANETITLEAVRVILSIPNVKDKMITLALETLKNLLGSYKKVIVYGALKTLDEVASKYTQIALDIFIELEKILENQSNNISFKALALSIFLKVSKSLSEQRLERMLKTITEQYILFKEEFKLEIVYISTGISQNDPLKYKIYFQFFTNLLKLQSEESTKLEIIQAIQWFISNVKEYKRQGLGILAEYVEDCPNDSLKTKILLILGTESSGIQNINQLIRHIYNRIILEGTVVRSAAISALGEIAIKNESSLDKIIPLIKNCLTDSDNEVRERAFFYYKALNKGEDSEKIKSFFFNSNESSVTIIEKAKLIQSLLKNSKNQLIQSKNFGNEVKSLISNPELISTYENEKQQPEQSSKGVFSSTLKGTKKEEKTKIEVDSDFLKTNLYKQYGNPIEITKQSKLNDDTAEYKVYYKKYIYLDSVIIVFNITNTIEDSMLKNLTVSIKNAKTDDFILNQVMISSINQLKYEESKNIFLRLQSKNNVKFPSISFSVDLVFDVYELDNKGNPHGDSYADKYPINKKIDIKYSDYLVIHKRLSIENFNEEFILKQGNKDYHINENKLKLPYKNIKKAIQELSKVIGISPLTDVNNVDKTATKYEFLFGSESIYGIELLIKLQMKMMGDDLLAKMIILSNDESIHELVDETLNNIN